VLDVLDAFDRVVYAGGSLMGGGERRTRPAVRVM
jgi:hypothetical protein